MESFSFFVACPLLCQQENVWFLYGSVELPVDPCEDPLVPSGSNDMGTQELQPISVRLYMISILGH
jgi:hypothetical protein